MDSVGKIIIAASIGLAIGGTLGLLFAPHKGKSTRKRIKRDFRHRMDILAEKVDEIRGQMEDKVEMLNKK